MAALSSKSPVSLVMSARLLTSFNQAVYSSLSERGHRGWLDRHLFKGISRIIVSSLRLATLTDAAYLPAVLGHRKSLYLCIIGRRLRSLRGTPESNCYPDYKGPA